MNLKSYRDNRFFCEQDSFGLRAFKIVLFMCEIKTGYFMRYLLFQLKTVSSGIYMTHMIRTV